MNKQDLTDFIGFFLLTFVIVMVGCLTIGITREEFRHGGVFCSGYINGSDTQRPNGTYPLGRFGNVTCDGHGNYSVQATMAMA